MPTIEINTKMLLDMNVMMHNNVSKTVLFVGCSMADAMIGFMEKNINVNWIRIFFLKVTCRYFIGM
ncbi:MAG: hypothetical protein WCK10_03720 [Candidatus Staskawiczbacteria bacterium]